MARHRRRTGNDLGPLHQVHPDPGRARPDRDVPEVDADRHVSAIPRHLPPRHGNGPSPARAELRPFARRGLHFRAHHQCARADFRRPEGFDPGAQDRRVLHDRGLGRGHRADPSLDRLADRPRGRRLQHLPSLPRPAGHDEGAAGKGGRLHGGLRHRRDPPVVDRFVDHRRHRRPQHVGRHGRARRDRQQHGRVRGRLRRRRPRAMGQADRRGGQAGRAIGGAAGRRAGRRGGRTAHRRDRRRREGRRGPADGADEVLPAGDACGPAAHEPFGRAQQRHGHPGVGGRGRLFGRRGPQSAARDHGHRRRAGIRRARCLGQRRSRSANGTAATSATTARTAAWSTSAGMRRTATASTA